MTNRKQNLSLEQTEFVAVGAALGTNDATNIERQLRALAADNAPAATGACRKQARQ